MNKKIWLIVLAVVIVVIGIYAFSRMPAPQKAAVSDPANTTYTIEGQSVTLIEGKAEASAAPGSATQITTTIFGQPVMGDLNNDGKPDAALVLVQDSGGSGTFYYVAAFIATSTGGTGTNAVILGDRIAPQNIAIQNGEIVMNYADRKPGEPMSATPSVGVTKYLTYNGSMLVETAPVAGPGEHCGGNMTTAAVCGTGYHCAPTPGSHLPFGDVGGTCVKD